MKATMQTFETLQDKKIISLAALLLQRKGTF